MSTVVTPTGGVDSFAATSTDLYVDTGTQLVTYTLAGASVCSFALPAHFAGADEVSQPVVDPSGDIYLSSYYGQPVDKFSPSGAAAVVGGPRAAATPRPVLRRHRLPASSSWSAWSRTRRRAWSSTVHRRGHRHLPAGRPTATSPRRPGGNLLYSANGYVETVSPTGTVLSTFGAPNIEGNDATPASGTQFYYPAQAVQGPDGTIYTADPLHTMEATSPEGILQGSTTLGRGLDFGGWNFALVGSTFYFQSGPPFNDAADAISSFTLATRAGLPGRRPGPAGHPGLGGGPLHAGDRQLLRPGHHAGGGRHLRRLVGRRAPATSSSPTRWRTTPP